MKISILIFIILLINSCGMETNKGIVSMNASVDSSGFNENIVIEPSLPAKTVLPGWKNSCFVDCRRFSIDLKSIEVRDQNGVWITLKDESGQGLMEFNENSINIGKSYLDKGNYNALLIIFGTAWSVDAIYTNTGGSLNKISFTNNTSNLNNFYLFSVSNVAESVIRENLRLTNAFFYLLNEPIVIREDEEKKLVLLFNTSGIIEVLTNNQGISTNFTVHSPAFGIQVR